MAGYADHVNSADEEQAELAAIDRMVDRQMPKSQYDENERTRLRSHLTWHDGDCGC